MYYFLAIILPLIICALLTPLIRLAAIRLDITDKPGLRKIHQTPVALMGGAAVFLSFTLVLVIFWFMGYITDIKITDNHVLAIILAAAILIIGGILDDIYSLKPKQQFIFPVLAALIMLSSGIKIQFVTNPFGGYVQFPAYLGIVFAFFWIIGMIYTTKFLDGLDGLVSGVTAIGALIIFAVSLSWDVKNSGTSYLALILAGACLGFLIYNRYPAKIFLGEGGSVLCGFLLGVLSIISGSKIATALLIMGIPILDVLWVIVRRLIQGRSPASADRKHLHFRLLDIGLSHRQAVLFLYTVTAAFGITSLFLHSRGKLIALTVLVIFMIILAFGLIYMYRSKIKSHNI
jgi:UDP-GlcNAc:undecaprenyl-phosphate GlcNAc-1-phosphate transferase